jgi:hypothetical protein
MHDDDEDASAGEEGTVVCTLSLSCRFFIKTGKHEEIPEWKTTVAFGYMMFMYNNNKQQLR